MREQYRVQFVLPGGVYYTEWFASFREAADFCLHAGRARVDVRFIENQDGEVV